MNLVHLRQSMSRSGWTLVPVSRWTSVQFNVVITRKRIETTSGPLLCHPRISEAHAVPTAIAACGQSGPSSRQGNYSRASVRFHTTANTRE
jgi:hypothetical protein